jgi:16S rRNA (cytosine967-C5)-methyltransferase
MKARRIALDILGQVEEQGAFASLLLDARLERARLRPEERALATELTYGVLRWQGRLDYLLGLVVQRPWEQVDPPIRRILRLGAYQLLFLTRVPPYAAIDETVALTAVVEGGRFRGARGFVNAVLRRLHRDRDTLQWPDPTIDPVRALAVRWSHPPWLVARWLARLGREETEALLQANNEATALSVAVNRLRARPDQVYDRLTQIVPSVTPGRLVPGIYQLRDGAAALRDPAFRAGWYFPMDEAAALPVLLLDPQPGETILDACAGGGGKAALILGLLGSSGRVLALDPSARAHRRLREARARLRLDRLVPIQADARQAWRLLARPVDRILVDAPCSGLGTLRRHPERKWRQQEAGLRSLAELQHSLLEGVAPLLKPGGILVYATCSLEPEETDQVIEQFRRAAPELAPDDPPEGLPSAIRRVIEPGGILRTWPHRHGVDGFFAVRLRRTPS